METLKNIASVMEALMVICFGVSWPLNVMKLWKSRTAKGTSILFYSCIFIGYVFAIVGKVLLIIANQPAAWHETVKWYVMFFYILNTVMVGAAIIIWFRNRRYDKKAAEESITAL